MPEEPNGEDNFNNVNRVLGLEGECKIRIWEFLEIKYVKAVFVMIVCVVTVVGLFALKYSPKFRKLALFASDASPTKATHLYITGNDKKR